MLEFPKFTQEWVYGHTLDTGARPDLLLAIRDGWKLPKVYFILLKENNEILKCGFKGLF